MEKSLCSPTALEVINLLNLQPHPEGGHYRENFRDAEPVGERGYSTAIYYLLAAGERSSWHRIDAAEVWHYYAGSPLRLSLSNDGKTAQHKLLGADFAVGERPQLVVPAACWMSAESLGPWTLIGCTVAPAFEFTKFELAQGDFSPV